MKYLKILILIIFTTAIANSQPIFKFNYSVSFPNSNLRQFVDKTSFSGLNLEYGQYFSRGSYSLGFSFGWNMFSQQYTGTTNFSYQSGNNNLNGAVTGNQLKYVNAIPLLITGSYYFNPSENSIVPFVSFGTGTYYIAQRYQFGIQEIDNDKWHFGISTEAGIIFKVHKGLGFNTSAKLNYAFDSGNSITGKADNDYSFWSINVGFTYAY